VIVTGIHVVVVDVIDGKMYRMKRTLKHVHQMSTDDMGAM
jgi:hypothetical protein